MATSTKVKVRAPQPGYNGKRLGVVIVNGLGETNRKTANELIKTWGFTEVKPKTPAASDSE